VNDVIEHERMLQNRSHCLGTLNDSSSLEIWCRRKYSKTIPSMTNTAIAEGVYIDSKEAFLRMFPRHRQHHNHSASSPSSTQSASYTSDEANNHFDLRRHYNATLSRGKSLLWLNDDDGKHDFSKRVE
jgi:hypothetical protein